MKGFISRGLPTAHQKLYAQNALRKAHLGWKEGGFGIVFQLPPNDVDLRPNPGTAATFSGTAATF